MSRVVVPLGHGAPRLLTLTSSGAAYAVDEGGRSTLFWADLHDKSVRAIVGPEGHVEQIAANADRLVWVEQDHPQTDAFEPISWKIKVLDLRANSVSVIAESEAKTRLAPGILIHGQTLVYSRYRGMARGTSDYVARDLEDGTETPLARDVAAGQFGYNGTDLVAVVTTDRGRAPGETKSDLFDLSTRPPTRITTSGNAVDLQMVGDTILWQQCDPDAGECSVLTERWPDGEPRLELTASDPLPVLGQGFFVMLGVAEGFGVPVLTPVGSSSAAVTLEEPPGKHLVGSPTAVGRLVGWVSAKDGSDDEPGDLVVVRLSGG